MYEPYVTLKKGNSWIEFTPAWNVDAGKWTVSTSKGMSKPRAVGMLRKWIEDNVIDVYRDSIVLEKDAYLRFPAKDLKTHTIRCNGLKVRLVSPCNVELICPASVIIPPTAIGGKYIIDVAAGLSIPCSIYSMSEYAEVELRIQSFSGYIEMIRGCSVTAVNSVAHIAFIRGDGDVSLTSGSVAKIRHLEEYKVTVSGEPGCAAVLRAFGIKPPRVVTF